ncbi:MAG: S8 family serine peptidase, partial [Chloroflexota bacterium]
MKKKIRLIQSMVILLLMTQFLQSTAAANQQVQQFINDVSLKTMVSNQTPDTTFAGKIPHKQSHTDVCSTDTSNNQGTHFVYLPAVLGGATISVQTTGANPSQSSLPRLTNTVNDNHLGLKVAYLYQTDTDGAQAYYDLLTAANVSLHRHTLTNLNMYDFSSCDAIIVSADSGSWSDVARRQAVLDTQLPIVGLGSGGLNLFQAGNLVSAPTGQSDVTTILAVARGQQAYQQPTSINLDASDMVALYMTVTTAQWLSLDAPLPTGVEIGQIPQTTHFPIVQLQDQHMLWGFSGDPTIMTQAGKDLFVNLLSLQGQHFQVPLASRQFTPQTGIEQAVLNALATTSQDHLHVYAQQKSPTTNPACDDSNNLIAAGLTLQSYLFGQTYIATISKDFQANATIIGDCIRWLGTILPADKVAPDVWANNFEAWADNGDGTVNLLVQFYEDVSDGDASTILASHVQSQTKHNAHTWAVVIPKNEIVPLSEQNHVRWIQAGPIPLLPTLQDARSLMFVDEVQQAIISGNSISYNGLDGSGVSVGIWDTGFDDTHPDFAGQLLNSATDFDDHGTHVAGIVGGTGANSANEGGSAFQWRGMAPGVKMAFYSNGFTDVNADEALNDFNVRISNFSVKTGACGGAYDAIWQIVDDIIRGEVEYDGDLLPAHSMIFGAGNEGDTGQYCPDETNGYTSVFNTGKNIIAVGNLIDDDRYLLNISSSRGPTPDGRIKPEVSATGRMVSTVPGDGYENKGGTSMASPTVSGIAALALQQYGITYGSGELTPASMKALLVNNATDLINEPGAPNYQQLPNDPDSNQPLIYHEGPDHATGFGAVHAKRTVDSVAHTDILEGTINNANDVDEYTIYVQPWRDELRFTLAWDDPGADPSLSDTANHLVNNLALVLEDPNGGLHYPWVLDMLPVNGNFTQADITPAFRAQDDRNNIEQVVVWASDVDSEDWEGTWTVRVSASSLSGSAQAYSLVGDWRQIDMPANNYPLDGGYNQAPETVIIPVEVENPHLTDIPAAGGISPEDWEVRIGHSG